MRRTFVLVAAVSLIVASCGGDDTTTEAAFVIVADPHSPAVPVTGFTASGEAVEQGMLCAAGEVAWMQTLHADTGLPESPDDPPQDGDVLWVEFEATCADGSGSLVLRAEATVDFAELDAVISSAEMSSDHPLSMLAGTGDYADASVVGVRQWSVATPGDIEGSYYDVFTGTLSRA